MAKRPISHPYPPQRFPWLGTFETMEEVNDYFGQETITCLLCGREFRFLHLHITAAHGIDVDKYKEIYGLPWRHGLVCKPLRERQSELNKERRASGRLRHAPPREHIEKLPQWSKENRRPLTIAARNTTSKRALTMHGRTERWGKKDYEEYLRRIKTGRTVMEVSRDPDMPNRGLFDAYVKENPDFAEKFEKVWDKLPFTVQGRAQRLGERFRKRMVELRLKQYTWPQIAAMMEVKENTVRTTWHRLKHNGELEKYLKLFR